jgi:glutathione S-transferase
VALTLYHFPTSSNALKVRFMLEELQLAYERVDVPKARPRPDWYLALNPQGGVPALDDDGFVLAESNAILRYLALRERRVDLYPEELRERAVVERLLDAWSTLVRPSVSPLERAAGRDGQRDDDAVAATLPAAQRAFEALEALVADNGTMTGAFTIADVCAAPTLFRARVMDLPLDWDRLWRLAAVRDEATARPAFAAADPVR